MAFDPCREWLGIDAVDLVDPRRVLGLAAGAGDAEAITRAAAARLEALGRVMPGPFAKAHAALVTKVHEAHDSLLAQALLEETRHRPVAPPPPPVEPAPVEPAPVEPAPVEVGPPNVPEPSASIPLDPTNAPPPDMIVAGPVGRRLFRPASSRSTGAGSLFFGSLALLAAAVVLLLALMFKPEEIRRQVAGLSGSTVPRDPGPSLGASKPVPAATATTGPRPPPEPAVPQAADPAGSAPISVTTPPATDQEPRQPMVEPPARPDSDLDQPEATGGRAAADARRQEQEAAEAERRAERERIRLRGSLDKSLGEAYAAVQRGEFDTADRLLTAAGNQVGDDVEAATRLERWRLFVDYSRGFTGYRDQAFEAAKAGRDYTVNGKTFALIEITPELFIYRLAGRNERVPRERIDPRIELAVVEKWFAADGRPANHLFLGARWLSLAPPNVGRARAEWRVAGDGGEEVGGLLALIDDPVIRRAAPGATP
jgi:hypothetical protein